MRCKFFCGFFLCVFSSTFFGMETKPATMDEPLDGMPERLEITDERIAKAWADIPTRAAQILALRKIGFTKAEICRAWDIVPQTYDAIQERYDPRRDLILPPTVGKAILAHRWQATAARAISHITTDKLEQASAAALATVAGIASDKALRLRESIAQDQIRDDVATLAGSLRAQLTPQADTINDG